MKAMILAAGLGTRLKPLTDSIPKALVEVEGEPLLSHVIRSLQRGGADSFVVNVHHFASQVVDYLHTHDFGAPVDVSWEKDGPLETGGAIKRAAPYLKGCGHFLVHNVDILSNLDVPSLVSAAREDALATLLVSERSTSRYLLFDRDMRLVGWTDVRTGEVRSPYPDIDLRHCHTLAFSGIHLVSEKAVCLMDGRPDRFPIIDFYLSLCSSHPIYGYVQPGFEMLDVGKISSLERAGDFISGRLQACPERQSRPCTGCGARRG